MKKNAEYDHRIVFFKKQLTDFKGPDTWEPAEVRELINELFSIVKIEIKEISIGNQIWVSGYAIGRRSLH